jgi:hypothetical protein
MTISLSESGKIKIENILDEKHALNEYWNIIKKIE